MLYVILLHQQMQHPGAPKSSPLSVATPTTSTVQEGDIASITLALQTLANFYFGGMYVHALLCVHLVAIKESWWNPDIIRKFNLQYGTMEMCRNVLWRDSMIITYLQFSSNFSPSCSHTPSAASAELCWAVPHVRAQVHQDGGCAYLCCPTGSQPPPCHCLLYALCHLQCGLSTGGGRCADQASHCRHHWPWWGR